MNRSICRLVGGVVCLFFEVVRRKLGVWYLVVDDASCYDDEVNGRTHIVSLLLLLLVSWI